MEVASADVVLQPETKIINTVTCFCCEEECKTDDAFCESCGYPLLGTIEERDQFINNRNYTLYELEVLKKKTKSATTTLYVLSVLSILTGIFFYAAGNELEYPIATLITYLVIAGIYLGLAFWSKKQALPAIVSGLVLFVIIQLLAMIDDPTYIVKGIILKVVVVVYLIKGIRSASEAQNLVKANNLR